MDLSLRLKYTIVAALHTLRDKNPADIKDTDHVVRDLGADSLDLVELVIGVEDEFNIEITDGEAAENMCGTIEDMVKFISQQVRYG